MRNGPPCARHRRRIREPFQLLPDLRAEQVEVGLCRVIICPTRLTLSLRSARLSAILLSMSSVNSIPVLLSKMKSSLPVSSPAGFGKGSDLSVSGSHEDTLLRCWEGVLKERRDSPSS